MRFEAEMKLNYRQLLALYTLSEKLFRRKQMLIYRVIFLAAGVWRTWTVCEDFAAEGVSFERIGYLIIGILFLIAGLIPNLASAAIARTRMAYSGKIQFMDSCLYEVVGGTGRSATTTTRSMPWSITGGMIFCSWTPRPA